ncbi:11745_t:CDS:2, partial [Funneliformis geosporum]
CVSLIARIPNDNMDNLFIPMDTAYSQKSNRNIERSAGSEITIKGQLVLFVSQANDAWSYRYTASKLDKYERRRISFTPRKHCNMCPANNFHDFTRPKLLLYPKIAYHLNIEDFNVKFRNLYSNKQSLNINKPDPIIQYFVEIIEIK